MLISEVAFSCFIPPARTAELANTLDHVMDSQSEFDYEAYNHHWEFPINKKITPM